MPVKININDKVTITPTERGALMWQLVNGSALEPGVPVELQLWKVMQTWGMHMTMTGPLMFETEITLHIPQPFQPLDRAAAEHVLRASCRVAAVADLTEEQASFLLLDIISDAVKESPSLRMVTIGISRADTGSARTEARLEAAERVLQALGYTWDDGVQGYAQ